MNIGFNKLNSHIFIERRINSEDIDQLLKYKRNKVLSLSSLKVENLEFLSSLKQLEDLRLYGCTINDLTALYQLNNLKNIFINTIRNENDNFYFLNELVNLEKIGIGYAPQFKSFPKLTDCTKLKTVSIFNCKNLENISNIETIQNLERFSIVQTPQKPKDLEFIMKIPRLKYFSGAFGGKKVDEEFHDLLIKHGLQFG